MATLHIPKRWDDVTPAWMNAAIASRHPDARIKDVTLLTNDDGTNRRARFGLTYAQGSGPEKLFLKAHADSHRWVHFRNGNLFNEARFFKDGGSLPVDHPIVYAAVTDYLGLDFLLVMEDLRERGADPRDATRPLSVEQVASGLRGLARLHSAYWNFTTRTHPKLGWIKTWKAAKGWTVGLNYRIPIGLERGRDLLRAEIAAMSGAEIVDLWSSYVNSLRRYPMTLLHGDAHIGNTYVLPNNEVGFLDWQVLRRGEWSQDVGYFLVGSLTPEDRRAHEKTLLQGYRAALQIPEAERPSDEQIWTRYRASIIYGLAIWLSTLGTDGWQSKDICRALVERYATAFVEHQSAKAIRA